MLTCTSCGREHRVSAGQRFRCRCGQYMDLVHPVDQSRSGALPYEQWPRWAKLMAQRRIDSDVGVGDTVKRYADRVEGERFERVAEAIGIPCGCTARRHRWNRLYPYKHLD